VVTTVPSLGEVLNLHPDSKYSVDDTKITTRCPRTDCFRFQRLSDAVIARRPQELRYTCEACGTMLVLIHRDDNDEWAYSITGSGIHIRLANASRTRTR
jgi:ferredoxin-like protein FixX